MNFKIKIKHYIEESAEVEVEADNIEQAIESAIKTGKESCLLGWTEDYSNIVADVVNI